MTVKVISPEKVLFNGEAECVSVPGTSGQFEVLQNHAPIISSLEKGVVSVGDQTFEIVSGFIEVRDNQVDICVEC